jgi:hypothetical protein
MTQAQVALAEAEAELGEAEAEPQQEECPNHSKERERHMKLRHAMSLLTCQHCHQCAFCEPRFDVCWTGGTGGYLPKSKWDGLLDEMIAHPDVFNFLKGRGYKVGQKRKLRMGYCKHYCTSAPSSTPLPRSSCT